MLKKMLQTWNRNERDKLNGNWDIIETLINGLRKQINSLVANAGKDNAENVAARTNTMTAKSYVSVGDRLDSEYQNVNKDIAKKVDRTYFDMIIANLVDGGPRELFYSVATLQSTYPNGEVGTYLVFDSSLTDGAHTFMWNGTAWEDLGVYQAADYKLLAATNLITNTNFTQNGEGWTFPQSVATVADGGITLTSTGANDMRLVKVTSHRPRINDKIYVKLRYKVLTQGVNEMYFHLRDWVADGVFNDFVALLTPPTNEWLTSSRIVNITTAFLGDARFYVRAAINETMTVQVQFDKPLMLNLTQIFGAGNEPTAADLDMMLSKFSFNFFDGTVDLFDARDILNTQRAVDERLSVIENHTQSLEKIITNEVRGADFKNLNDWSLVGDGVVNNGILTLTSSPQNYVHALQTLINVKPKKGDKIYVASRIEILSHDFTSVNVHLRDWTAGGTFNAQLSAYVGTLNNPVKVSGVIDVTTDFVGDARFYVRAAMADIKANQSIKISNPFVVNLTQIFGAGNEPSATEFEKWLSDDLAQTSENIASAENIITNSVATKRLVTDLIVKPRTKQITQTSTATYAPKALWTITYDDESKSVYDYAFPVHKELNAPAMFYVIPDRPDTNNIYNYGVASTWDEIKEMRDWGFEIGNHGEKHANTSYMSEKTFREHLERSNDLFLAQGIIPKHFSHPGGAYTLNNINVLQEYYESSATTIAGVNGFDLHPLMLKRRSSDAYPMLNSELDSLATNGGWLTSYHHAIHPSGKVNGLIGDMACWTPQQLRDAIAYAQSIGIEVCTLDRGLRTYAPFVYYYSETTMPIYAVQRNGVVVGVGE